MRTARRQSEYRVQRPKLRIPDDFAVWCAGVSWSEILPQVTKKIEGVPSTKRIVEIAVRRSSCLQLAPAGGILAIVRRDFSLNCFIAL